MRVEGGGHKEVVEGCRVKDVRIRGSTQLLGSYLPLVFKSHTLLYHSASGLRVIKKKKKTCRRAFGFGSLIEVHY